MRYPNFTEEKKLWKKGFEWVIGLDEAGRGPLAGPVVASSVSIATDTMNYSQVLKNLRIAGIRDSKTLPEKQREYLYEKITNNPNIRWAVAAVSERQIDKINILNATKLAMQNALENLRVERGYLLIDGNFRINAEPKQRSIIGGDAKVFSIAVAGIIAKVTRDRLMKEMHQHYPQYGFDRHKGYGTATHIRNLQKFGPCEIHRRSFFPVSVLSKVNLSDKIESI